VRAFPRPARCCYVGWQDWRKDNSKLLLLFILLRVQTLRCVSTLLKGMLLGVALIQRASCGAPANGWVCSKETHCRRYNCRCPKIVRVGTYTLPATRVGRSSCIFSHLLYIQASPPLSITHHAPTSHNRRGLARAQTRTCEKATSNKGGNRSVVKRVCGVSAPPIVGSIGSENTTRGPLGTSH